MTIMIKTSIAVAALVGLTACGGATTGGTAGTGGSGTTGPPEIAPTLTPDNIIARRSALNDVNSERLTGLLPTGNGSYSGAYLGTLDGSTPRVNQLHGTISMTADLNFSGDKVSGTINNLHVARDGVPIEKLGGSIGITGTAKDSDGTLSASLAGTVAGRMNEAIVEDWTVTGSLTGSFRDEYTGRNFIGIKTYDEAALVSGAGSITLTGDDTTVNSIGDWYGR